MELHREEERLCRELGNKAGLSASLGDQAIIHKDWGDRKRAMELHREEERLCRESGNKAGIVRSLANQAITLKNIDLLEEAYQIAITHGLNAPAEQIKPILEAIRAKLR